MDNSGWWWNWGVGSSSRTDRTRLCRQESRARTLELSIRFGDGSGIPYPENSNRPGWAQMTGFRTRWPLIAVADRRPWRALGAH